MNAIRNESIKHKLFTVACIYYLADLLLPMMAYYSSVYVNIFFVLIILYTVLDNSNAIKKHLLPFLLIIFLTLIDELLSMENFKDFVLSFYKTILKFLPIFLSIYLISNNNSKLIRLLIITSLIFLSITSISSIHGYIQFPFASRELATGSHPDALVYSKMNIGGFSLVYMIPVILPMIVAMSLSKRLKLFLVLFFTLPLIYFVYRSQYTTGIISVVIVIISLFIFYKYSHLKLILITYFVVIILLYFGSMSFNLIQEVSDKQTYEVSKRLNALIDLSQGKGSNAVVFTGRYTLYLKSINTFISYPVLGGRIFNSASNGEHSVILDMLANYGLIGIIALYLFYVHILRKFYKAYKHQPYYGYMILSLLISLFLSVVNTSPNIFAIGFFVPTVAYSITTQTQSINR